MLIFNGQNLSTQPSYGEWTHGWFQYLISPFCRLSDSVCFINTLGHWGRWGEQGLFSQGWSSWEDNIVLNLSCVPVVEVQVSELSMQQTERHELLLKGVWALRTKYACLDVTSRANGKIITQPHVFMLTVKAPLAATVFSYTIGVGTQIIPPHQCIYRKRWVDNRKQKGVFFPPKVPSFQTVSASSSV